MPASVSQPLPLSPILRFTYARRMRPLSVERARTPFIPRRTHHSVVPISCKAIAARWLIGKDDAGAHRAGGQGLPNPTLEKSKQQAVVVNTTLVNGLGDTILVVSSYPMGKGR